MSGRAVEVDVGQRVRRCDSAGEQQLSLCSTSVRGRDQHRFARVASRPNSDDLPCDRVRQVEEGWALGRSSSARKYTRAARSGVTAVGVAGRCTLPRSSWADAHLSAVHTLQELDPTCVTDPDLSIRLLRDIGRRLAMSPPPRGPEGLATQVAGT